jgi:hypothetical protein
MKNKVIALDGTTGVMREARGDYVWILWDEKRDWQYGFENYDDTDGRWTLEPISEVVYSV